MHLVNVELLTCNQINYLVAMLEGRVLQEPITATKADVEKLQVPFTLYEVNYQSDGEGNNRSADITPITVTEKTDYGDTILFTDHTGRECWGTTYDFFSSKDEAELEAAAFVKGMFEGFDPCNSWEDCGPIFDRMLLVGVETYSYLGECFFRMALPDIECTGVGPTPRIAAMRCYIISKFGLEVALPEGVL